MREKLPKVSTQTFLFDPSEFPPLSDITPEPAFKAFQNPVWTENKAQFIMRYLRYFVFITRHGTYIDGFAGPQEEKESDCWAAKLVLNSEPRWLRHFYLCDEKRSQAKLLERLRDEQPTLDSAGMKINRDIHVYRGDFNRKVDQILDASTITENEATFCLLDQRTFECEWQTVEKLARFKKLGRKIELFYFLANSWSDRALHAQEDMGKLTLWWGRADASDLKNMSREDRRDRLVYRMKNELGYWSVKPWPIYQRHDGGIVMYYMIHATDHPDGPSLMARAYRNAVSQMEPAEQLDLELQHPHPAAL
jgi:three-Cys-motif partner protein